jgi:tRNA-dihydrouridine synthase B
VSPPLVLAPLAGISDLPFRMINRSWGCRLAFTEMISCSSLVHGSRNTLKMLSTEEGDRPLGVQILAGDPETAKRALDILSARAFDVIDFNAACPAGKVVGSGKGAGLLKEPERLQKLLKVVVENAGAPVTVKIRSGWDDTSVNAVETALRAQEAGVRGLFIHGRTRMQKYRGTVDYRVIRQVKEALAIPVIASGDALSPALVKRMFDETGCDGVALARGALGNPWIFRSAAEYLENGRMSQCRDIAGITAVMKEHLGLNIAFYGETTGVMLFRKFFAWYTKGMALKELRGRAFLAGTQKEMVRLIDETKASSHAGDSCRMCGR